MELSASRPDQPSPSVLERIQKLMASPPVEWRTLRKGHTAAETWLMRFESGKSAFVKHATDEQTTSWLKSERAVYEAVQGDFLPDLLGWDGGDFPILILEDLSHAATVPPWTQDAIERVFALLEVLARTKLPDTFRPLTNYPEPFDGWHQIAKDPGAVPASSVWYRRAGSMRRCRRWSRAEAAADLSGDSLVHTDLRSDNIFFHRNLTMLIDWNWASRGNPKFDLVSWLPSLHTEGGPPPWEFTVDEPNLIAMQAGYLAHRVATPPHDNELIRRLQEKQLRSALPWAAKALGLPPLDVG